MTRTHHWDALPGGSAKAKTRGGGLRPFAEVLKEASNGSFTDIAPGVRIIDGNYCSDGAQPTMKDVGAAPKSPRNAFDEISSTGLVDPLVPSTVRDGKGESYSSPSVHQPGWTDLRTFSQRR